MSHAATDLTAADLAGVYVISIPQDAYFQAYLDVSKNGTYTYNDLSMEHGLSPEPCVGEWGFKEGLFSGVLDCSTWGGPAEIHQAIDLTSISRASLQSHKDQLVLVKSSVLGPSYVEMRLRKMF